MLSDVVKFRFLMKIFFMDLGRMGEGASQSCSATELLCVCCARFYADDSSFFPLNFSSLRLFLYCDGVVICANGLITSSFSAALFS